MKIDIKTKIQRLQDKCDKLEDQCCDIFNNPKGLNEEKLNKKQLQLEKTVELLNKYIKQLEDENAKV